MTDPMTLVRAADPAADLDLGPAARARLDAALERMLADEPAATGAPAPVASAPRRLPRARKLGVALATAAACAAGLVVALPGGGGRSPGVAPASAATVLREARAAALAPGQPGPWTGMTTRSWHALLFDLPGGGTGVAQVPYTTEVWASDDGEQLLRNTRGRDLLFPRASDEAAFDPARDGWRLEPNDGQLVRRDVDGGGGDTVAGVHALPTDPDALAARLAKVHDGSGGMHYATGLLLSPLPTPELRAALYTVLLRTPGIRLEPGLTDPEGRTGVGVRFVHTDDTPGTDHPSGTYDTTLLFDPETHELLGVREIGDHTKLIGRTITSWVLVVDARRAPEAPRPDLEERLPNAANGLERPEYVPVR